MTFLLFFIVIIFYSLGGVIDYWQAAMEHKKKLPRFLRNYFMTIWLIIYSGILPFLLVVVASNFNLTTSLLYFSAACIGAVIWDVVYSLLDTKKYISHQEGYYVHKGKNYGLAEKQILLWHGIRLSLGISALVIVVITKTV